MVVSWRIVAFFVLRIPTEKCQFVLAVLLLELDSIVSCYLPFVLFCINEPHIYIKYHNI